MIDEHEDDTQLRIDDQVTVPKAELTFRATRAGGPGGQHVNTSSTRVELTWDVASSPSLDDAQRARVLDKLATRIDGEGVLRLTDAGSRSQHQNRETVTERFRELLAEALKVPKKRKRTRPPRAAKEKRLKAKKQKSEKKRLRGPIEPHD